MYPIEVMNPDPISSAIIPLQQGLKLSKVSKFKYFHEFCNYSITTRIETVLLNIALPLHYLSSAIIPLQQGLKLMAYAILSYNVNVL